MADAALPRKDLLRYGILALPLAFAGMPLYVHAPDFYTTQMDIPLGVIGVTLLALRFLDALQDPILGRISDAAASHRLGMILLAALLMVVNFYALFHPLEALALPWFIVTLFLATLGFSMLSINLNTIGGLWSRDSHQKTRITSYREAFGLVGLLIAVILPSVLQQMMTPTEAFGWVSLTLALFMLMGLVCFVPWHRQQSLVEKHEKLFRVETGFITILKALPAKTRYFFTIYGISMLASSMPAILILFFVRDRLEAETLTGLFLGLYFLAGVAGMPLWQSLSRRHGKYRVWALAMILAVVSFIWAGFLGAGDSWQFAVICVLSGIAFGADLTLPPSILADHIHEHQGDANASLQFSLLTFLLKASLALASAIVFPLLDAAGFEPAAPNSDTALFTLSIAYALLPCAIKLLATGLLWRALATLEKEGNHVQNTYHSRRSNSHA